MVLYISILVRYNIVVPYVCVMVAPSYEHVACQVATTSQPTTTDNQQVGRLYRKNLLTHYL